LIWRHDTGIDEARVSRDFFVLISGNGGNWDKDGVKASSFSGKTGVLGE